MMRSFECYYSYFLERCSFCFGCIGLKNKSYCILNQQYTKEEWYEKVASIMENMKTEGTLGSFFPATLNPFYFDDTLAGAIQQDIDPALPGYNGFLFSSQQSSNSSMYSQPLLATQLSQYQKYNADGTSTISRELLPKVIQDTDGKYYTFQNMEIEFYERYGLPLPTKHWMTRIIENFQ